MSKPPIDDIDREIIDRLSSDARMSNRAIAEALGVTEGTIRARLRRMREARLIRFTALTNLSRLGSMRIVFIRIRTNLAQSRVIAEKIAAMDEIKCVIITTGKYNILAMGPLADIGDQIEATTGRIGILPGVLGMETSITIQAVKYNIRTAKIITPVQNDLSPEGIEDEE